MQRSDDAREVLRVLAHGRANRHHICQQSGLGAEAAEAVLGGLAADGLVTEVDRGLYAVTAAGKAALDRDYPAEGGFLREADVIHDAPATKTVRMRGDRDVVEVQVDAESVAVLADALREVLDDTHSDHEAVTALDALVEQ